jgi:methionyl-tRNA formyltransferase
VRVVFMGTPAFAVPSLLRLAADFDVAAVYVRPDAVSGRGRAKRPSPVKTVALGLELPVLEPPTLRDEGVLRTLDAFDADFVCVAAYGLILPPPVLDSARYGSVNVHASLLPRWRGAAPIQRAILAGDEQVGVSIMRMEEGLDTGPYCAQGAIETGAKNAALLTEELGVLGADLLVGSLPSIAEGAARWVAQDEALVTYAEKVAKADVAPSPELDALTNVRRIRASLPTAPARVRLSDQGMTLVDAQIAAAAGEPGPALPGPGRVAAVAKGVLLGAADGAVLVTRIRPDGKGDMEASAWLRGARLDSNATWASAR